MPYESQKKIIVLGAGITGLTIANELSKKHKDRILLVERESRPGGLATTITRDSLCYDLGSHRLHTEASPSVLNYIQEVIGEPLLKRQRHGRLYFRGKFLRYPPDTLNFIRSCSLGEIAGFAASYLKNVIKSFSVTESNYETEMIKAVGGRMYIAFFKDYAIKLWGCSPREISVDGKRKRTIVDLKSLKSSILGRKHYYYYPRKGIGIIANKLAATVLENGGEIITNAQIKSVCVEEDIVSAVTVERPGGSDEKIEAELVLSTIPIDDLFDLCFPDRCIDDSLQWRGARMVHVVLDERVAGDTETYYFPSRAVLPGRVSEVRKYSPSLNESAPGSVLTIEIPTSPGDAVWLMDDDELLRACMQDLVRAGIFKSTPRIVNAIHMRLEKVYPVYRLGWETTFRQMYDKLSTINNLYTLGRNGLYLHCNIDHCIAQGLALAGHITKNNNAGRSLWNEAVAGFFQMSARD